MWSTCCLSWWKKHLTSHTYEDQHVLYGHCFGGRIDSSPRKVQTKCRSFLAASTLIHRRLAWETWGLAKVICCWQSNLGLYILLSWNYQVKEIDVFCLQLQVVWTSDPISGSYLLVSKHFPRHSSADTGCYIIPIYSLQAVGMFPPKHVCNDTG